MLVFPRERRGHRESAIVPSTGRVGRHQNPRGEKTMTTQTATMIETAPRKTAELTVPGPARAAAAFWAWLNARANRSLAQAHFDRLEATSPHLLGDVRASGF
jgi:hypothetical protein